MHQILISFIGLLCLTLWPDISLGQNIRITNAIGMTFIRVDPGRYIAGSPDTEPYRDASETRQPIAITRPFYLQDTEVTRAQWESVMGKSRVFRRKGQLDIPVTRVSYHDCQKFIRALNRTDSGRYRLPTEAEWEYACRAGTTTAYFWGDDIDCTRAMYANNAKKFSECLPVYTSMGLPANGPAPVRSFAPNPWGFYDMHGNVWEWCSDVFTDIMETPGAEIYASTSALPRIRRGGSWFMYGWYLRSANRAHAHPGTRLQTTGFRLVLEADK